MLELLSGAHLSRHTTREIARVETLWSLFPVCWPNRETVEEFAAIRAEITRAGTPIGLHDMWIAAMARQHRMSVASSDDDFRRVRGIRTVDWR